MYTLFPFYLWNTDKVLLITEVDFDGGTTNLDVRNVNVDACVDNTPTKFTGSIWKVERKTDDQLLW